MRSVSGACSSAHSICMRSLGSMRMHTGMHYQEDSCVAILKCNTHNLNS
jgi:hypothetical protein